MNSAAKKQSHRQKAGQEAWNFSQNNKKMKIRYYVQTGLAAIVAVLSGVSCTDTWDDHYEVSSTVAGSSLWANMQDDEDISPFVRVLEAAGYDDMLDGDQVFTVWAPIITDEEADEWIATYNEEKSEGIDDDDNSTVHQFIENHIALFNYQISSLSDNDSVKMMNGKYLTVSSDMLNDEVSLVYDDEELYSVESSNGVLYKIDGIIDFFPNLWERIQLTTGGDDGLDSLANFFLLFQEEELDEESSVAGDIVDGEQLYLDSVMVTNNEMFQILNADLDCEDSLYWFVAATNKIWAENVDTYLSYFQFHDELEEEGDSLQNLYAKELFVYASCFSERGQYTYGSFNADDPDSLCATTYRKQDYEYNKFIYPFREGGILYGLDYDECSNGRLYIAGDEWRIKPTETSFMGTIKVEAENSDVYETYLLTDDINNNTSMDRSEMANDESYYSTYMSASVVEAENDKFDVSSDRYLYVTEVSTRTTRRRPEISFWIPNTLSNVPYDIKVVFATPLAGNEQSTDTLKRQISAYIRYYTSTSGDLMLGSSVTNSPICSDVDVDATKMDTITVVEGQTFPVCNYAEEDPRVILTIRSYQGRANSKDGYTQDLCIDCIILEPHLEDEDSE